MFPKLLTEQTRQKFNRARLHANMGPQARSLYEDWPDICKERYGDDPSVLRDALCDFVDEIRAAQITDADLRARCMLLAFLFYPEPWPAFIEQPFWHHLRQHPKSAEDLFRDYCALLKHASNNGADIPVWW